MLKKEEIRMIHKWLREGMSKSSICKCKEIKLNKSNTFMKLFLKI